MAMASGNPLPSDRLVKLSKKLSYFLRHAAKKKGLKIDGGGFISVDDLLGLPEFKGFSIANVQHVVDSNDKQRFSTRTSCDGRLEIRANQGHSFQLEDLELLPITDTSQAPQVIHGTYMRAWNDFISKQGLHKMKRTHIHFAMKEPTDETLISGARQSCQVLISIDLEKALNDNYKFFKSANDVILCSGNEEGFLPTKYFKQVIQRKPRMELSF